MRPADAVTILEDETMEYLTDCVPVDFCTRIAPVARHLGVSHEIARAVLRGLRDQGLAEYERGLWTEDGEPAGAGYSATKAGRSRHHERIALLADLRGGEEQKPPKTGTAG